MKIQKFIISLLFLSFAIFGLFAAVASAQLPRVEVVSITDGDTLRLKFENGFEFDARLHGVDAPELAQPRGINCREVLIKLVANKALRVWIIAEDVFNRKLVKLLDESFSEINIALIGHGCAYLASPRRREKKIYKETFIAAENRRYVGRNETIPYYKPSEYCEPRKFRKGKCPD